MPARRLLTGTTRTGVEAELVLVEVETFTEAISALRELTSSRAGFALLLVCDARSRSAEDISAVSMTALLAGMHYFSSWGPGCERVHDIVDADIVDLGLGLNPGQRDRAAVLDRSVPARGLVTTTWHDDEPLSETLEFVWAFATPAGEQEDSGLRLVMTVDMPEVTRDIHSAVEDLPRSRTS